MIPSPSAPATRPARIVIGDDHQFYIEGFISALRKHPEVKVVGYDFNGRALLELVERLHPDVVFTDILMPVMNGIEVAKEISTRFPYVRVIALSTFFDDWMITDMIDAGAAGYLVKNTTDDEIIEATERVMNGKLYYCTEVANRLVELNKRTGYNPIKPFSKPQFTEVELNVMKQICLGLSNKEIATALSLYTRQVERLIQKLTEKCNCINRTQLAVYAVVNYIFKP